MQDIDLTIIGNCIARDGIGNHAPSYIDAFSDHLNLNVLPLPSVDYTDVSPRVIKTFQQGLTGWGKVAFWVYILGLDEKMIEAHKSIKCPIKIAFSVFESSLIPQLWVQILNSYYDLVVVPDPYLINVYKNSGVKIPIFVIPLGIKVENLLSRPAKLQANDPFVFGMSAGFWKRKNHIKILQAFGQKFGNNPKFKLKLHGRFGSYKQEVQNAVLAANYSNVELLDAQLSTKDYNDFMDKLDCYVFGSSGEGFSITPRECLALGKPVILTNNSVHGAICDTKLVIPVPSEIKMPAIYEVFKNQQIGYFDDCEVSDLANAMQDTFENYDTYLANAQAGREWVKQYLWENLAPTYINLIKPRSITFGKNNLVSPTSFQTNDKRLFQKFKKVFSI